MRGFIQALVALMTELEPDILPQYDLSALVIPLLKGVIYLQNDGGLWGALLNMKASLRDCLAVLGLGGAEG